MRKRSIAIIAPVLGTLALLAGLAAPAHAAPAARALAQPPLFQICNDANTLCMNHSGGNHGHGAHIIAWNNGDPNNDFHFFQETTWCNHGKVEIYAGGGCPFKPGSGLNSLYDGAAIVSIQDDGELCTANGNSYGGYNRMVLQNCGANGYIYILANCFSFGNCAYPQDPVINLYWTNNTGNGATPYCAAFDAKGQQMIQNDDCDPDTYSGFTEIEFV
jgi:hypothetical protein